MIAAVFVPPGQTSAGFPRFRGRTLDFWIPLCFPGISFFAPEAVPDQATTIMVCNPDYLPAPDVESADLSAWIRQAGVGEAGVTVGGGVLGILPRHKWAMGAAVEGEGLSPPFRLDFLDARRLPWSVEDRVVRLQLEWLLQRGVLVEDRRHFYMEGLVPVGDGSVIGPGTNLRGDSRIGKNVRLTANCWIENSEIGDDCQLLPGCVIRDSRVEHGAQVGPFAHLRMQAQVGPSTRVGNFVEIKKSVIGEGSKASHLTYLGDAHVGRNVNVGAGTITCNYDGFRKHPTEIGDGVFIGSGTELVAPVRLERNSYVGAGSTITQDVPENSLAIARQRQRNIVDWCLRKHKKKCD